MDYTIIGSEVNLASRLESHADPGGILLSHETYSLIKTMSSPKNGHPFKPRELMKALLAFRLAADAVFV